MVEREIGVIDLEKWLINIQARAAGSAVIIVGTHLDVLTDKYPFDSISNLIERKYIRLTEPEKHGLPVVVGYLKISCTATNKLPYVQMLHEFIWRAVDKNIDRLGTRLVDQKFPISYIQLQNILKVIVLDRKLLGKDPILNSDQYKHLVIEKMEERYGTSFEDNDELNQATTFLHENGVLLHYDDINLQEVYFIDPQWLCFMLASIINVQEINGHPTNGVMKIDDIPISFKGIAFHTKDIKMYMIHLLQKFEIAIQWDNTHILLPSLLPIEQSYHNLDVNMQEMNSSNEKNKIVITNDMKNKSSCKNIKTPKIINIPNSSFSLFRLYSLSYFPAGFWARMITNLLGDESFYLLAMSLYDLSILTEKYSTLEDFLPPCWQCWQTGLELYLFGVPLVRIKQVNSFGHDGLFDYDYLNLVCKEENSYSWSSIIVPQSPLIELVIFNEPIKIISGIKSSLLQIINDFSEENLLYPNFEVAVKLLNAAVDHVDVMLEDWFPDLGTRFFVDTKGVQLVNRIVPCNRCLYIEEHNMCTSSNTITNEPKYKSESVLQTILIHADLKNHDRFIENLEKYLSKEDISKNNYLNSRRRPSHNTLLEKKFKNDQFTVNKQRVSFLGNENSPSLTIYCFYIEECIYTAQSGKNLICPKHGNMGPFYISTEMGKSTYFHIAPDVSFYDLEKDLIINHDEIIYDKFLGRGSFGSVFSGIITDKKTNKPCRVALKCLKPHMPKEELVHEIIRYFEYIQGKWEKYPLITSCEAYIIVRKELSIMLNLKHDNVVSFLGICVSPLAIILSLAPMGALRDHLLSYRKIGCKLPHYAIADVILQAASALDYLHSRLIIYRDLKSENILVWTFPKADQYITTKVAINIKLADYGISRVVAPSGTKGIGGTLVFMAPEILIHGGQIVYTEKVDIFSFSMVIYELLTLKLPYEGSENIVNSVYLKGNILSGNCPPLTDRDTDYPINILDLMTQGWAIDPNLRFSAKEIERFAKQPEFCNLLTSIAFIESVDILCACSASTFQLPDLYQDIKVSDVWMYGQLSSNKETNTNNPGFIYVYSYCENGNIQFKQLKIVTSCVICMCLILDYIWCATSSGTIHIFQQEDDQEIFVFTVCEDTISIKGVVSIDEFAIIILSNGSFVVCSNNPFSTNNHIQLKKRLILYNQAGNDTPIHSIATVSNKNLNKSYIWCGQNNGIIAIWEIKKELLSYAGSLSHASNNGSIQSIVSLMTAEDNDTSLVYSYLSPGTIIYGWNSDSKIIRAQHNLLYSIPEVDRLHFDVCQNETYRNSICQATCLKVIGNLLYIGTSFGCLIALNKFSLKQIYVCRPYSAPPHSIKAILPLFISDDEEEVSGDESDEDTFFLNEFNNNFNSENFISNENFVFDEIYDNSNSNNGINKRAFHKQVDNLENNISKDKDLINKSQHINLSRSISLPFDQMSPKLRESSFKTTRNQVRLTNYESSTDFIEENFNNSSKTFNTPDNIFDYPIMDNKNSISEYNIHKYFNEKSDPKKINSNLNFQISQFAPRRFITIGRGYKDLCQVINGLRSEAKDDISFDKTKISTLNTKECKETFILTWTDEMFCYN